MRGQNYILHTLIIRRCDPSQGPVAEGMMGPIDWDGERLIVRLEGYVVMPREMYDQLQCVVYHMAHGNAEHPLVQEMAQSLAGRLPPLLGMTTEDEE